MMVMMKICRKCHTWDCNRKESEDEDEKFGLSEELLEKYFRTD